MTRVIEHVIWWLIAGTRGGIARGRIICAVKERPMNAHQLALLLNAPYKTTKQHLKLLLANKLITAVGGRYGRVYFPSPELESNWNVFLDVWNRVKKEESLRAQRKG